MRALLVVIVSVSCLACAPSRQEARSAIDRAASGPAAVYAPSELAQARALLDAADNDASQLRAAVRLAEEATRIAEQRRKTAQSEAVVARHASVQQRVDVENLQQRVAAMTAVPSTPVAGPARQWSPEALDDAMAAGSPLTVLDVGDERRCERAHLLGALCVTPAQLLTMQFPEGRELVVMGDGERPGDARVDAALKMLQDRGLRDVGVMPGGMKAWRSDARQWVGTERGAPMNLQAVLLDGLDEILRNPAQWTVIDVRPAPLFQMGHLGGARHVPVERIEEALAALPSGSRVLVYGADDRASMDAARIAARVDGRVVSYLSGGVRAAVMAGVALEGGAR